MDTREKVGLGVGGTFGLGVIALLALLFSKQPEVPSVASWERPPAVVVCSTAPQWAKNEAAGVVATLAAGGVRFGRVAEGPCVPCSYVVDGLAREAVCDEGAITIDLRGQAFSEAHAGETLREYTAARRMVRASITLPSTITDDGVDVAPQLPHDAYRLALAHELVHALGYEHSQTRIRRGAISRKSGELMHPDLTFAGWGLGGLP